MLSKTAEITIQDIADSIGVQFQKSELTEFLFDRIENEIQSIVKIAHSICLSSHKFKLTAEFLNVAIESRGEQNLLGYQNQPIIAPFCVPIEGADIFPYEDEEIDLSSEATIPCSRPIDPFSIKVEWSMVDGNITDRPMRENLKLGMKDPTTAGETLSAGAQSFYLSAINFLRPDAVNSHETGLDFLSRDHRYPELLPYFLQFIIGKITENIKEYGGVLISFTRALLSNESFEIYQLTHTFLRIAFTFIVSHDIGPDPNLHNRRNAAQLLYEICQKCSIAYPTIKDSSIDSLTQQLFEPDHTISAYSGILLALDKLEAIEKLKPHLQIIIHQLTIKDCEESMAARQVLQELKLI